MPRKRKAVDDDVEGAGARRRKRVRNRASPSAVVKLYPWLSPQQKAAIKSMELDSMLDIKCPTLHNPFIDWFADLYDKHTRQFVVPGRGRIPLNVDTVFRSLGLPIGTIPVPYYGDAVIQASLGATLFPNDGSTPATTRVFEILKDMKLHGNDFKQICVMYFVQTLFSPTTCNHVSNKCYPIMVSFLFIPFLVVFLMFCLVGKL